MLHVRASQNQNQGGGVAPVKHNDYLGSFLRRHTSTNSPKIKRATDK